MKQLVDKETGEIILKQVEVADTFWKRFKGLQLRRSLPSDTGLWIKPCSSLHTCFMRFPIDVVMLDQELKVIGIRTQVKPWRALVCEDQTRSVIETTGASKCWTVGQSLELV